MSTLPVLLRIDLASLRVRSGLSGLVTRRFGHASPVVLSAYAVTEVERAFATAVLSRKPSLWVFRANQRAFAGDFIIVDMSPARLDARSVWAVELKRSGRMFRGATRGQQRKLHHAVRELYELHVTSKEPILHQRMGPPDACLQWLGVGDPAHVAIA